VGRGSLRGFLPGVDAPSPDPRRLCGPSVSRGRLPDDCDSTEGQRALDYSGLAGGGRRPIVDLGAPLRSLARAYGGEHPSYSAPSRRRCPRTWSLRSAGSAFWLYYRIDTAFLNSRFATSLFGIAALAASAAIALHARRHEDAASPSWLQIAGASIIALNLVAVLASVRELETTWRQTAGNPEADLQKSLAISAFLMVYGAGLLAVGFWKRSAFIRWQALVLLVFTIGKTFLYDTRDMSQGYRVLSFLGLGALLMAISFAYQKDWLALREAPPNTESDVPISNGGADR
jgi:hypothetical protein